MAFDFKKEYKEFYMPKNKPESVEGHAQRNFFCFHDYDYYLDVSRQTALMPEVKPLAEGLKESYEWFRQHRAAVMRRPYLDYINQNLAELG